MIPHRIRARSTFNCSLSFDEFYCSTTFSLCDVDLFILCCAQFLVNKAIKKEIVWPST